MAKTCNKKQCKTTNKNQFTKHYFFGNIFPNENYKETLINFPTFIQPIEVIRKLYFLKTYTTFVI